MRRLLITATPDKFGQSVVPSHQSSDGAMPYTANNESDGIVLVHRY